MCCRRPGDGESRNADRAGARDEPADLVLRNGLIYDLVSGEMFDGDVAICDDMIVGVGDVYDGREVLDLQGLTLVPVSSTRISMSNPLS
jgi:adenine deaminase